LVSFFIALFVAIRLYPHVAGFLRGTAFFGFLKDNIGSAMNLEHRFAEQAASSGYDMIEALPLPGAFRALLQANNTPQMFEVLQVASVQEYIAGFFANIVINAVAILAVFVLAIIILNIIGGALDLIAKLPVVRTLNGIGGLALGIVTGGVFVWLALVIMTVAVAANQPHVQDLMDGSTITQMIFDNDFILPWLVIT